MKIKYLILAGLSIFSLATFASETLLLQIEGGGVWQHRNDVEIPPGTGTRLEVDNFNEGPFPYYRIESYYRFNKSHGLRLVYSPLEIEVTGRPDSNVNFNGQIFSSNQDLTVTYKFNSYRMTYVYGLWGFGDDQLNVGFTGKVRDAETKYCQAGNCIAYANVGFVPLVYFEYQKPIGSHWTLNFAMDFAAASQGRAIDGAIKIRHSLNDTLDFGLGFRGLEGGADNRKVFTFSWFTYGLAEIVARF